MGNFNLGTNLSLTGGKLFLEIIFEIKIEINILHVPNFNKF